MEREFSHISAMGKLRMVDVTATRDATTADGLTVSLLRSVDIGELEARDDGIDPVLCARIAGVSAAKRTADCIPLCDTLNLNDVDVELNRRDRGIE